MISLQPAHRASTSSIFSFQDDISDAVQKKLSTEMAAFGFAINKALVTEVSPNAEALELTPGSRDGKEGMKDEGWWDDEKLGAVIKGKDGW